MAEVQEESTHVWSAQARIALFLSDGEHEDPEYLALASEMVQSL